MSVWKKLEVEKVEHEDPAAVVFRVSGILTDTKEAFDFLDEIRASIHKRVPVIVVNLKNVDHVTSAGVGVLAAAYTSAQRDGSKLCLVEVQDRSRQLLELVGLWAQVAHYDTEAGALE